MYRQGTITTTLGGNTLFWKVHNLNFEKSGCKLFIFSGEVGIRKDKAVGPIADTTIHTLDRR